MMNRPARLAYTGCVVAALAASLTAYAGDMDMKMSTPATDKAPMKMQMSDAPAHFKPTRSAYTTDHRFLLRLVSLPKPIPYQKYFSVRLAVYDGHPPHKRLTDARVDVTAGMRHGRKHGFAHGMDSSPKLSSKKGIVTAEGMYFHMMGPWILKATVDREGKKSVAYFRLPCCGK